MSKRSPYQGLPRQAFWRTGVAGTTPETIQNLWTAKATIKPPNKVETAGSCFAQHIARFLRQRDCKVLDVEPPPPGLDLETAHAFGYSMYSARYGNIYTARQLLQLTREAFAGEPL